ncbi:unnamed protein product [Umbelopsis vinacea]
MSEFAVPSAPKPKPPPPQGPALAYSKPEWSSAASFKYSVEILKMELLLRNLKSISRYHAIIQFNEEGKAFLYDLGSGHGTRKNKQQVNKHSYVPLADGDQIKFGESTRICIFHTEHREEEDEEEESKEGDEVAITMIRKRQEVPKQDNDEGITWGLPEDAVDEEDEDIDENDPKAIEAAEKRIEARAAAQKERMKRLLGDDDDSDDDSFYDRTGAVEKNKTRKTNKGTAQKVETYDTLIEKQKMTQQRITDLEAELKSQAEEEEAKKKQAAGKANEEEDDLESFMEKMDETTTQRPSKLTLQKELQKSIKELARLDKLVKLTKPTEY